MRMGIRNENLILMRDGNENWDKDEKLIDIFTLKQNFKKILFIPFDYK